MIKKQRILSGIQPTGVLHIGNYFGAIKQWVAMQDDYESYFCIVDLHAITVRQEAEQLRQSVRRTAATYLACGVDPRKSVVFVQSQIPAHAELAWILSTFTPVGELERMTQFKDKAARYKDNINAGLFTYPILMAADILLYQSDVVPVGEDQKQHVELARDIAQRINQYYKKDIFIMPRPLMPKQGARLKGLDDPAKKMSKSAASAMNYISFFDDLDTVRRKIKRAVTDSGTEIKVSPQKPALTNLLTIYSLITNQKVAELEKKYQGKNYAVFKADLAEVVIAWLRPIQAKIAALLQDQSELDSVLAAGAARARVIAARTLNSVQSAVGLADKNIHS